MAFRFLRAVNVDGTVYCGGQIVAVDAIPADCVESLLRNKWVEVVGDVSLDPENGQEMPTKRKRGRRG